MKQFLIPVLMSLGCLLYSSPLQAQGPPVKVSCGGPEYRQMDFWLGDWDVFNPKGDQVGSNRIESILGTCVLMENWESKSGSLGHSFNIYNAQRKRWEQTWVDNSGGVIYFNGNWDEKQGKMIFFSESQDPEGKPLLYRMVFTPQEDGSVQQLWEASANAGLDWSTLFNGTYRKKN